MIGAKLGSYEIRRQLGSGGMGAVYVAEHALLGRQAAVKVLLPELCKNADVVARFFHEAKAATAIRHPSIVEVYDFGYMPDGAAFIVMELLDGESLAARLRRVGRLPSPQAISMTRQIANALAAAHARGIVHRDLKPDNIYIVVDPEVAGGERIKLLDFGIAKLATDLAATGIARTSTGLLMGTPIYMSPEQCRSAGQVDHRSDLYSLGCILHEMLTGSPPFTGEGAGDLIAKHIMVAPPPPSSIAPGIAADVDGLVARLLHKSPADRIQTAADLAAACTHLVPTPTPISIPIPPHASSSSPIAAMPTPLATPMPLATPAPVASGTPAPAPAQLARVIAEPVAPIPPPRPPPPPPSTPAPVASRYQPPPQVAKTTPVQRPPDRPRPPGDRPLPPQLVAIRARNKRMYWYIGAGLVVVAACTIYFALKPDPFMEYMKKSKRSEAEINLEALRRRTLSMYIDQLKLPAATPVTPSQSCCESSNPAKKCDPDPMLWATGGWEELFFSIDEPHYFRYEIVRPDSDTVVFRAYGDLDCDNTETVHELTGRVVSGNLQFESIVNSGTD